MVTRFHVGTNRPTERLNLHVSWVSPLPKSYRDAFNDPNWQNAMRDEYTVLIKNKTWTLVPRPPDTNIVRCMWLFRYKYLADGMLSRYKARLVVNGSTQLEGVDVDETFSPFVKLGTIQTGIDTAYLLLNVDDIVLTASSEGLLQQIVGSLHQEFAMTDLGLLNYFLEKAHMVSCNCSRTPIDTESKLGVDVIRSVGYLHMHDPREPHLSALKRISRVVYLSCNPVQHQRTKHIEIDIHFVRDLVAVGQNCNISCTFTTSTFYPFSGVTEELKAFLSDVSNSTLQNGSKIEAEARCSFVEGARDVAVLDAMLESGIKQGASKKYAIGILEKAHMVSCNSSRTPIDTESKLGVDGYLHMHDPREPHLSALKRILRNLLRELHTPMSSATLDYCDNVSVVYLSCNPVQHQRTKHIEIDIHFVRDLIADGQVRVLHVPSRYQFADIFTKGLPSALFEEFRSSLSVRCPPAPTAREC
nr:ribonuclease H-like domain-containing protein [Tanacetum cinerariifolium]